MSARARLPGLNPLGTARSSLGAPASGPSFPDSLRASMQQFDLPEEALYLAWELARLAEGIDDRAREALLHLALATLVNVRQGSTRLPLPFAGAPSDERHYLDDLFAGLGVQDGQRAAVTALLNSLPAKSGLHSGSATGAGGGVIGRPGDYLPLLLDGNYLYQQRMLHYEERLVAALGARLVSPLAGSPKKTVDRALDDVAARPPRKNGNDLRLSEEQFAAVRKALASPLTVISGGPGTGKTSIVVSILRALVRLGVPIETVALAAPTGKAANRMDESIKQSLNSVASRAAADDEILAGCPDPRTLHRLLGYMPSKDQFKHHENNRLSEQVVIVDECSMIDLFMMDQLVRSVRADARLILLGDADQLPSVDAGAVFRDLVPTGSEISDFVNKAAAGGIEPAADPRRSAAVRLTRSYRMDPTDPSGRAILTAGHLINLGHADELLAETGSDGQPLARRSSPESLAFDKVELLDGAAPGAREAFLACWHRQRVLSLVDFSRRTRKVYRHGEGGFDANDRQDLEALFKHFESFRILCITRGDGRPTGAEAINARLHQLILAGARSDGDLPLRGRPALFPGEPVMMQHNDYDRGLFNGDQGLILRVSESGAPHHFMAVFPRKEGYGVFHVDSLRAEIRLSFAITVHKGQGSEFDYVAVVLPEDKLPILTRELLYTAVTRSRRSVVILGSEAVLRDGTEARLHRYSGIGERLAQRAARTKDD